VCAVEAGGVEAAAQHAERTLMLCWPPRDDDDDVPPHVANMASDALLAYR
jgi:hypothetical protein